MNCSSFYNTFVGNRCFYREVWSLLLPMIIQQTVTNVVGLLDNLMVGAVGTLPMSAVAIINQILFVFTLFLWGSLSGPSIFSTQYAGAQDDCGVRHCFRFKLLEAGLIVLFFTLGLMLWQNRLISLFLHGGQEEAENIAITLNHAKNYLRIMVFSLPPFAVSMTYATTLRELKETRLPMIASVTAIFVNLLFNYFLIFGKCGFPRMGVAGAALATVFSRIVEMAILLRYTHANAQRFAFIRTAFKSLKIPMPLAKMILLRGLPLSINEFLFAAGISTQVQSYSLRGLAVVAAVNITMTVANVFNCVFYATGGAISVIVGHELGASRTQQARDKAWKLVAFSIAISIVMAAIFCALAKIFVDCYNVEPNVKSLALVLMWLTALVWPFRSFVHSAYFIIRAGGRTMQTTVLDSGYIWLVVIPVACFIANRTAMDIRPFYFIIQFMTVLQCFLAYWLVRRPDWSKNII